MPRTSTKKQEIYDYLTSFIAEHGYSPSIREIGSGRRPEVDRHSPLPPDRDAAGGFDLHSRI